MKNNDKTMLFKWNCENIYHLFVTSLLFLLFLFLWEYGKVEDSPDREEASGCQGEEDIAVYVVVNL